jgi:hypothetical protein
MAHGGFWGLCFIDSSCVATHEVDSLGDEFIGFQNPRARAPGPIRKRMRIFGTYTLFRLLIFILRHPASQDTYRPVSKIQRCFNFHLVAKTRH